MPDLLSPRRSPHNSPHNSPRFPLPKDEVHALPDILPRLDYCSTRLRNAICKQSKGHEINVLDYKHGLKYINTQFIDITIAETCQTLYDRIREVEREITEEIIAPLEHHQDFKSIDVFNEAWEAVVLKLEEVFSAVSEMEKDLINSERKRLVMSKQHLLASFDAVKAVGHWVEAKICSFFDAESQMINRMSINNFEQFTSLASKLKLSISHKMIKWRRMWEVEILKWKDHLMERTVAGFDTLINSEEYRVPAGLDAMHEIVLQEQQAQDDIILAEYSRIVKNLPYNKDNFNNFSNVIGEILEHKEEIYETFMDKEDIIFEELQERVESRFVYLRDFLNKEAGCSEQQFDKNFRDYLPGAEKSYDSWVERYKEIKCCRIRDNLQHMAEVHSDMLQYLHSICNMWENNQSVIKDKEQDLLNLIGTKRKGHQKKLLKIETEIDNNMQKLKYRNNLAGITALWDRITVKLESLKAKYSDFGDDVRELLAAYPAVCLREVEGYIDEVFTVIDVGESTSDDDDIFLEVDGKKFIKLYSRESSQTVDGFLHPIVQQICNKIKDKARREMIQHTVTMKAKLHVRSNEIVDKAVAELDRELEMRLTLHKPRDSIVKGEFTRRARDISVFETKLDLYYETAQKHENEMKTLFERLNTDTNDVIKDFEVALGKVNDEVLKEQHSAGLYKRRDAAIKLFTSYELKLIGLFQDGWSQLEVEIFDIKVGEKAFTQYAEEGLYDFAPGSKHHAEFVEFNNKTKGITPNTKKTVKQMESIKKKQLTSVMNQSVIHYKHCLFSLYFQERRSELLAHCRLQIKSAVSFCNKDVRDVQKRISALNTRLEQRDVLKGTSITQIIDEKSAELECINKSMKKIINCLNYRCSPIEVQNYSSLMQLTQKYEQFAKCDGEFEETLDFCKDIMNMTRKTPHKFSSDSYHNLNSDTNWVVSRSDVEKKFIRGKLGCIYGVGANILDVPSNPWSNVCATLTATSTKSFWLKNNPQELEALNSIKDVKMAKTPPQSASSKASTNSSIVSLACKKLKSGILAEKNIKLPKRTKISDNWGEAMQRVTEGKALTTSDTAGDTSPLLPKIDIQNLKYEGTRKNSANQFNMQSALTLTKTVELMSKRSRRSSVMHQNHKTPIFDFVTIPDAEMKQIIFNPISFFKLTNRKYNVEDLADNIVSIIEKVKFYLLHIQEDFIVSAEIFYRQKHIVVKHPEKVSKNVDISLKEFKHTVGQYLVEARSYSKRVIDEIKLNLTQFQELHVDIPRVLFVRIKENFFTHVLDRCELYTADHNKCVTDSFNQRQALWGLLGPKLAHPSYKEELVSICNKEEWRRDSFSHLIIGHKDSMLEYLTEQSESIISQVTGCTKKLYECAQGAIQADNIRQITAEGEKTLQIKNRLRDSIHNKNEESKGSPIVIDTYAGKIGDDSDKIAARNTELHQAVIQSRNDTMDGVEWVCEQERQKVLVLYEEWRVGEERWAKRWSKAVSDIAALCEG